MNRIRAVDPVNSTITVEAGCVLQTIQEKAVDHNRLFPLSLAAEGSCQIGGNLSTNAGGVHVMRYGNMRELTLGLEVVLPSGEVWHGLRGLLKDNTGYDLKQLFIGAEGTLGIITAATLKLSALPRTVESSWSMDEAVICRADACCSVRWARSLLPAAICELADATCSALPRTSTTMLRSCSTLLTGSPLTDSTTSPGRIPARAAAPETLSTSKPPLPDRKSVV